MYNRFKIPDSLETLLSIQHDLDCISLHEIYPSQGLGIITTFCNYYRRIE